MSVLIVCGECNGSFAAESRKRRYCDTCKVVVQRRKQHESQKLYERSLKGKGTQHKYNVEGRGPAKGRRPEARAASVAARFTRMLEEE